MAALIRLLRSGVLSYKHCTRLCKHNMASLPADIPVVHGNFKALSPRVQNYIAEQACLCDPDSLHICDGTDDERDSLMTELVKAGGGVMLTALDNCIAFRSNPADVARVESKTLVCTKNKRDAVPNTRQGSECKVGQWMDSDEMDKKLQTYFSGCMRGRTMYVIPFSMGPVGSPLSKTGIQLTDSAYVAISMKVMTRMGAHVLEALGNDEFVKCLHSVGRPLPAEPDPYNWPCNPEKTVITHFPDRKEIKSFGSGYGGNALLGKKCFALRIASVIARDEGWLAEHMLILGITSPEGKKRYIAAAFPSQCGKTNLAMMTPTIPGWKVECVGDDIAWMKFDEEGVLRAINPECGFFGVAPGTSTFTNPNALASCQKNTIFTNVATTSDGSYWWEGLEKEGDVRNLVVTDWLGKTWRPFQGTPAAHPNSRFCAPASNCPMMDPLWEDPKGVPISALIFGGRRPQGVPLVFETFGWKHGVFVASSLCSEATSAAEFKGRQVMRDPMAMRPFFGYNAGRYFQHWLDFEKKANLKLPKVFHVNWFRRDSAGRFLWPGYGDNARVLKWICDRLDNAPVADRSPIGWLPKANSLDVSGLGDLNMTELMSVPKAYWEEELASLKDYYEEQFGEDLPAGIWEEYHKLKDRIAAM